MTENHNLKAGFIVANKKENGYEYGYFNYKGKKVLDIGFNEIKRINNISDDENQYLVVIKGNKAGILKNDKTILDCEYEDIQFDSLNNLVIIQKDSKQGVCDINGSTIIPIAYDNIIIVGSSINAQNGEKITVFDEQGNPLKNEKFISIIGLKNKEYYISIDKNEKYGVLNSQMEVVIDNKYDYLEYISDNNFIAEKNEKMGAIDIDENTVIKFKYDMLHTIQSTQLLQGIQADTVEIMNHDMEVVTSMKNAYISAKNGYIKVYNEKDRKYFLNNGEEVSGQNVLNEAKIYSSKKNDKWGFVNQKGEVIIDYTYDYVTELNEYGYAGIKKNGKWGVINEEGKIIQEPTYELDIIEPDFIGKYYSVDLGYGEIFYSTKNANID